MDKSVRKYDISVDELVHRAKKSLEDTFRSCVRIEYEGRIPKLLPQRLEEAGIYYVLIKKEEVIGHGYGNGYVIDLTHIRQIR